MPVPTLLVIPSCNGYKRRRGFGVATIAMRGAGSVPQSIHSIALAKGNSSELPLIDPQGSPPDAYFDRQWAVEVLNNATLLE